MSASLYTNEQRFLRVRALLGSDGFAHLATARIAVVGIGGVGSAAAEALARSGVGFLRLIDKDMISVHNINRQLHATEETVGCAKTEAMRARILSIAPSCFIEAINASFTPEMVLSVDYVLDAIDDVHAKVALALACRAAHIPFIASMGTGNRLDPSKLRVGDVYETKNDPLAKVMRRELRAANVDRCAVVWSEELPRNTLVDDGGKHVPASMAFVPNAAGLLMASVAVRHICTEG